MYIIPLIFPLPTGEALGPSAYGVFGNGPVELQAWQRFTSTCSHLLAGAVFAWNGQLTSMKRRLPRSFLGELYT